MGHVPVRTEVDFAVKAGTIRRALYSSGWGGRLAGPNSPRYTQLKPLNPNALRPIFWNSSDTAVVYTAVAFDR